MGSHSNCATGRWVARLEGGKATLRGQLCAMRQEQAFYASDDFYTSCFPLQVTPHGCAEVYQEVTGGRACSFCSMLKFLLHDCFASRAWRGFVDPMIAWRREVRDLSDLLSRDYPYKGLSELAHSHRGCLPTAFKQRCCLHCKIYSGRDGAMASMQCS